MTRTPLAAALLVLSLLGAAGCGGSDRSSSASDARHSEADVAFVRDMLPHHRQALEMVELVLDEGPGPEVAALARQIQAAQEPEVATLERLLRTFGAEEQGGHGGHGGGHGGDGMMSEQDMAALGAATGAQAERLFLQGMVEHHRGAVEMAARELDAGRHPEALSLARSIRSSQEAEVRQMEQLLARG